MVSYSQCGMLRKQWVVSTQPIMLNRGTSVLSITWGHHKGLHIYCDHPTRPMHTVAVTALDHMSFPTWALKSIHTPFWLVLTVNILIFVQTALYTNSLFAKTCLYILARSDLHFEKCKILGTTLALQLWRFLLLFMHIFIHQSSVNKIKSWSGHFRKIKISCSCQESNHNSSDVKSTA